MMAAAQYLAANPLVAIFLCLGLGSLIGKIKIGSFGLGATASTLIVAMGISLWAGQYTTIAVDKNLRTVFFAMFTFALGFDVGPAFFKALRSSGIRIVLLAVSYAVITGLFTLAAGKLMGYDSATIVGLYAGAFTQSAVMGDNPAETLLLTYTLTYFIGTIASILFAQYILPAMLRVDLLKETKRKADSMKTAAAVPETDRLGIVQVRAYAVGAGCAFAGQMAGALEQAVRSAVEVEAIHRGGKTEDVQTALLAQGDVLTVVGDLAALDKLDELGLTEVSDAKYFQIRQKEAQIVLTTEVDEDVRRTLTAHGVYIKEVERGGSIKRNWQDVDLKKGDILHVYGPENAVRQAVDQIGYLKDNKITTDIPFFSFALAASLVIGSISFLVMGKSVSLGASFGALVVGLLCGWGYEKYPRFGHVSESTRWFIKSIGLNLFVAGLGLTSALTLGQLLSGSNLIIMLVGAVVALLARVPVMYIGKYLLKLDTVDLVGGLCGSGTNTPALNAVAEYTGSSLYALSFAPGYAVGNVVMILVGLLLGYL